MMIRTQIYLQDTMMDDFRTGAMLNKTTVSEYIRQLLHEKSTLSSIIKMKKINPLLELAKLSNRDPKPKKLTNISGNFDKYLPIEWR